MNKKIVIGLLLIYMMFLISCATESKTVVKDADISAAADATAQAAVQARSVKEEPTQTATLTFTLTAVPTKAKPSPTSTKEAKTAPTATKTAVKKVSTPAVKTKAVSTPVKKEEITLGEVIEKIEAAQVKRKAIVMNIDINTKYTDADTSQRIKGLAYIVKPDKFKVIYSEPTEQQLISDGKTVWVYTPVLSQAIKQDVEQMSFNSKFYIDFESSIAYFSKRSRSTLTVSENFYLIKMIPIKKQEMAFDELTVKVNKETLFPESMKMKYEAMIVESVFSNIKKYSAEKADLLPEFKDSAFTFKAPEGIEIIEASDLMQGNPIIK
ncbi:MAG: outer membrane lipoprotein carrier protein LolA [Candidatus Goldbacteria bacterium]|nr:outer membrane lipoprotein carrier protein LolA [Candidatus Goldiibacteriota bacterium]